MTNNLSKVLLFLCALMFASAGKQRRLREPLRKIPHDTNGNQKHFNDITNELLLDDNLRFLQDDMSMPSGSGGAGPPNRSPSAGPPTVGGSPSAGPPSAVPPSALFPSASGGGDGLDGADSQTSRLSASEVKKIRIGVLTVFAATLSCSILL